MNLDQWEAPLPKPWLNVNVNSLRALNVDTTSITTDMVDAMAIDAVDVSSQHLLLDQSVVVAVPPAGFSLLYADNTDRINVASQSQPTQQIAYLSDVPVVITNEIISTDAQTMAKCSDGGLFSITLSGTDRMIADNTGYTSLRSGDGASNRIDLNSNSIYMAVNGNPVMYILGSSTRLWDPSLANVLKIDDTDVFVNNNVINTTLYSQIAPVSVTNTNVATSIVGLGLGTMTLSPVLKGSTYSIKNSGTFRTNGIGRTLTVVVLKNGVTMYSTGTLVLPNIASVSGYVIDIDMHFLTGTQMSVTFKMSFNTGTNTIGGFVKNSVVFFDPSISTSLDCTCKWNTASLNNTLFSNTFLLNKIF